MPRFILIHPAVRPQYTNVTTDRQDGTDKQTGQTGQRSDSIGRTVLQTVVQNGRTDRDAVWVEDSDGPQKPCIGWNSDHPLEGAILTGENGRPLVKYSDSLS